MCVIVYLQSTAVVVMDAPLIEQLRRIVGEDRVYTAEHELRTY